MPGVRPEEHAGSPFDECRQSDTRRVCEGEPHSYADPEREAGRPAFEVAEPASCGRDTGIAATECH